LVGGERVPRGGDFYRGWPKNSLAMVVVVKHGAETGAKILFTLKYAPQLHHYPV